MNPEGEMTMKPDYRNWMPKGMIMGLADEDVRYVLQQYVDRAGELRLAVEDARGALVERPSYLDEVRR